MTKVLKQEGIAVLLKSHILRGCTFLHESGEACGKLTNFYIKCDRAHPTAVGAALCYEHLPVWAQVEVQQLNGDLDDYADVGD